MRGSDLAELYRLYGKEGGEGKTMPLEGDKNRFLECYMLVNEKQVNVTVYDGRKFPGLYVLDGAKVERIRTHIFFKEYDVITGKPKWLEAGPKNLLIEQVKDKDARKKLYDALSENRPVYYTTHLRDIPNFDNAITDSKIKFIIEPSEDQKQWVDHALQTLDNELCFTPEDEEKFLALPYDWAINILNSRATQYRSTTVYE